MDRPDIKAIRRSLGLNQTQFGALLGAHAVTVCRWESETDPARPTAYQMGLIQEFARAAQQRPAPGPDVGEILVTAGVVAAIFLLLQWASGQQRSR